MKIAIIERFPVLRSGVRVFLKKFPKADLFEADSVENFAGTYPAQHPGAMTVAMGQGDVDNFTLIKTAIQWYELRTIAF